MGIDVNVLVEHIKADSVLWNLKNKKYFKRKTSDKAWMELSQKMKVPKIQLKNKWKYLRNQFRSECKRIPPEKFFDSTQTPDDFKAAGYTSWPYFKTLFFLRSQIKSRKLKKLYSNNKDNENIYKNRDTARGVEVSNDDSKDIPVINAAKLKTEDNDEYGDYEEQISNTLLSTQTNNCVSNHKPERQERLEKLERKLDIIMQQNSRKKFSEQEMDEDRAFFRSLLPHLKTLTPAQKLLCRIDIQSNVHKHAYAMDTGPSEISQE